MDALNYNFNKLVKFSNLAAKYQYKYISRTLITSYTYNNVKIITISG